MNKFLIDCLFQLKKKFLNPELELRILLNKSSKNNKEVILSNLDNLNIDLTKKPLIQIDKKNFLNIPFTHCNTNEGCVTSMVINDEVIKSFKSGKELTLVMGVFRSKDNLTVTLPLKGFSKAYDSLLK